MTILPSVVKAEYRGEYRISLTFNDGASKTADFLPWLQGPIFEPLRDVDYFRGIFASGSTVCWPQGADIAPVTLYAATDLRQVVDPHVPPVPGAPGRSAAERA